MRYALLLVLASCAAPVDPCRVAIVTQGWDAYDREIIVSALDEWAGVGVIAVGPGDTYDTRITVTVADLEPPILGVTWDAHHVEIARRVQSNDLHLVAAHEFGHALSGRRVGHLPPGDDLMSPAGGDGHATEADYRWATERRGGVLACGGD